MTAGLFCELLNELVLSVPIFDANVFWAFAKNFSVIKPAEERSGRGEGGV